jgi:hypothetical protein
MFAKEVEETSMAEAKGAKRTVRTEDGAERGEGVRATAITMSEQQQYLASS